MKRRTSPSRRAFLYGLGGVTLALPFLESLSSKARADNDGGRPRHAFFLRFGNGVQQADNSEPERFWPHETGALTTPLMRDRDADRATGELSAYAGALTMVKGTRFGFPGNGCGHSGGGNQVLTAAPVSDSPSGAKSLAMGESIDNYIARAFTVNGGEPLTLYTGPRRGYIEEVLSYRGAKDLRSAEDDPWNAYQRLVGVTDGRLDRLLEDRRKSVNDLVREQMQDLLRKDLSTNDRRRLELHFDSIRDFEVGACVLSEDEEQAMASLRGQGTLNDNRIPVARLHMDLVALAFSCDMVRAATLQVGDGNDQTEYTINGTRLPNHHWISHRIFSDGSSGDPIPDADLLHHQIDRLHAQTFKHLLDRLSEAGILDDCVAVWTNDLGAGVSHTYRNIPWVIAGSGGGYLKTGQHVDLGGNVTHNKLLSTLASAVGVRKPGGDLVDDFGHSSLEKGQIDQIIAG
ncbi:MAG: DUF1552 domain-containing protein [Myxococcota bacterium]